MTIFSFLRILWRFGAFRQNAKTSRGSTGFLDKKKIFAKKHVFLQLFFSHFFSLFAVFDFILLILLFLYFSINYWLVNSVLVHTDIYWEIILIFSLLFPGCELFITWHSLVVVRTFRRFLWLRSHRLQLYVKIFFFLEISQ